MFAVDLHTRVTSMLHMPNLIRLFKSNCS